MYVHVPPPPSPRARELAQRIVALIQEERSHDPSLDAKDVQDALRIATRIGAPAARAQLALLSGILVLGLGAALVLFKRGSLPDNPWPMLAALVGVLAIALTVGLALLRRP